jgi:hypothetical protein
VFSFRLSQEFKKRAAGMVPPFPRGVVPSSASINPALDNGRFGAYAAVGAIALGGVMLMGNIAHNRSAVPVAEATAASTANATDPTNGAVAVKLLAAPQPDAIAVAPAMPVATPVAAEKSAVRVDTSTTGAIASPPLAHPKHKPHRRKTKDVDSQT